MGRVIKLLGDRHRDVQELLPWYVVDRLEPDERAEVEAHLAECEVCRAELAFDRQLDRAVGSLPLDVEQGWAAMQQRLQASPAPARPASRRPAWLSAERWRMRSPTFGWALAAQAALLVVTGALLFQFAPTNARYHALGAAPADTAGNLVVIFDPNLSERAIREILRANGARMVDGPTAADAYVLHVPAKDRPAALGRLRENNDVVLAEPIDASAPR